MDEQEGRLAPAVGLYWIPLGAGGYVVRLSGKLQEALKALAEHRPRLDLYHSARTIRWAAQVATRHGPSAHKADSARLAQRRSSR